MIKTGYDKIILNDEFNTRILRKHIILYRKLKCDDGDRKFRIYIRLDVKSGTEYINMFYFDESVVDKDIKLLDKLV